MALLVQKFGGTSVGTPDRIQKVADRIAETRSRGQQLVVVVSAMGHTTDELIALAHQVSHSPPHREMDMLLTAGERISMALLSMALSDRKVEAVSLTGSQSGIITDDSHRRAKILEIRPERVRSELSKNKVVIVAGFQGVSRKKEVTTLGRGGSDTSAVALASALEAELCEIYTDVDGVYTCDPRLVPQAKLWKKLPIDLMTEMASLGAGVLHPRSVQLARQFGVNLSVKNSMNHKEGTALVNLLQQGMEDFKVACVVADTSRFLMMAHLARPSVLGSLWDVSKKLSLSLTSPLVADGKAYFYIESDSQVEWTKELDRLVVDGFLKEYRLDVEKVPLSVIGDRLSQDGEALSKIIDCLGKIGSTPELISSSSLSLTVEISKSKADEAVKMLHQALIEGIS